MNIPKYVIDMLNRSEYNKRGKYDINNPRTWVLGYTIDIHKATDYEWIDTHRKNVERLVKWANRQVHATEDMPVAYVNRIEQKTHYRDQVATVTIFDPVMQKIEPYICYKKGVRP